MILDVSKENHLRISSEMIERVSYGSNNPFFKTKTFRYALIGFRVDGWVRRECGSLYEEEMSMIEEKLKERGLG